MSLDEIPEISIEPEDEEQAESNDTVAEISAAPKQKREKFKKFIQKVSTSVAENVEVLTRRTATEIEQQSAEIIEEHSLDLREMGYLTAEPVWSQETGDSKSNEDAATSIWLIDSTTDSEKLIVVSGFFVVCRK